MEENTKQLKLKLIDIAENLISHINPQFNCVISDDVNIISNFHFSYTTTDFINAWYAKSFSSKTNSFRDVTALVSFDKKNVPFMLIVKHRDTGTTIFNMDKSEIDSIVLKENLLNTLTPNLDSPLKKSKKI